MKILLGTKNVGKIDEISQIFSDVSGCEFLSYRERPFADVPETGAMFRENALLKARTISEQTGLAVLAEDSGLEVEALGGAPGVHSARFAGEGATDEQNIAKLLNELEGMEDRRARFVCVAVLALPDGREYIAQGELAGRIALRTRGTQGFGYDPVFIPEGYEQTLAELGPKIKNSISHRRRALERLKRPLLKLS